MTIKSCDAAGCLWTRDCCAEDEDRRYAQSIKPLLRSLQNHRLTHGCRNQPTLRVDVTQRRAVKEHRA